MVSGVPHEAYYLFSCPTYQPSYGCWITDVPALKVYVAAVAANHSLEAGPLISRHNLINKFSKGAQRLNQLCPSDSASLGLDGSPEGPPGPSLRATPFG